MSPVHSNGARPRLRGRVFYGIIAAGVVLGAAASAGMGWAYLEWSAGKPTGRRIWDGLAVHFVVPISVMMGATFGGLAGVAAAIGLDLSARRRESRSE
jgi:hypothetical protein